jgi:competence protein ComFC
MEREIKMMHRELKVNYKTFYSLCNWLITCIYFTLGIQKNIIDTEFENVQKKMPAHEVRRHHLPHTHDITVNYIHSYKSQVIKKAIWRMKYNNDKRYIELFGNQLSEHINKQINKDDLTFIIPVPSTPQRLRIRGMWTTRDLAQIASRNIKKSILNTASLSRKDSPKQSHHTRAHKRISAIQNIYFTHKPEMLVGKNIICIDDVSTTGATLADIRRVCKDAGCASFTCWVIAD